MTALLWCSYVVTGLSVAFQIAGLVTPWWVVVDALVIKFDAGLWYANVCVLGVCNTMDFVTFMDEHAGTYTNATAMMEMQLVTTVALLAAGGAMLFLHNGTGSGRHPGGGLLIIGALLSLSGHLSTSLATIVIDRTADLQKSFSILSMSPVKVPRSAFLTGYGGILAWTASFVVVLTYCCCDPRIADQDLTDEPQENIEGNFSCDNVSNFD